MFLGSLFQGGGIAAWKALSPATVFAFGIEQRSVK